MKHPVQTQDLHHDKIYNINNKHAWSRQRMKQLNYIAASTNAQKQGRYYKLNTIWTLLQKNQGVNKIPS